jgi:hypothetical protein
MPLLKARLGGNLAEVITGKQRDARSPWRAKLSFAVASAEVLAFSPRFAPGEKDLSSCA